MKKNNKKIIVGIILSISIIGIGTIIYLDKTSTPELEIVVDESVLETESTEAIAPEEIEEVEEVEEVVENTEEKPQGKKLNAYDAQKFLASQAAPTSVATNKYWEEQPVEEVSEPETVENVVINEEPVASTEIVQANVDETGHYNASGDISDFASYPMNKVDFSNNANLIALQAEVNPLIYAECGGGNPNTGFVLESGRTYISYAGETYGKECYISTNGGQVILGIYCNLNDIAWKCITATLEEIYPSKGAILSSEVKKACESGSPIYSSLDKWVEFSDMHTKVIYDTNDGNLLFIFR